MFEEKIKVIADENFSLEGILTLPKGSELYPAVVLVHGSGPNNRDEAIGKTALFKDLAEKLAAKGIASIRYDKRTLIYGKEIVADKTFTVAKETVDDAIAAGKLLSADARIDANKIYLIGHSMGAMLAPRIVCESDIFAGLILMAGSPRRLEAISLSQNEEALAQMDEATRAQVLPQIESLKALYASIDTMTDEVAQETPLMPGLMAYYLKEWGAKPADSYLSSLMQPILVMQGDKDFQVSIDKDFDEYKRILDGHKNARFKLYSNLNHLFMPWQGKTIKDGLAEYQAENHLSDEVAENVIAFILK